jgi:hypothetical protein
LLLLFLMACCLVSSVIYLLLSRSLPSNVSTCRKCWLTYQKQFQAPAAETVLDVNEPSWLPRSVKANWFASVRTAWDRTWILPQNSCTILRPFSDQMAISCLNSCWPAKFRNRHSVDFLLFRQFQCIRQFLCEFSWT